MARSFLARLLGLQELREITIAQAVVADVSDMAQSAHPKEMLAFFSSTKGIVNGVLHIDELQLQAYQASNDSASVFISNLPMTTTILGTVHSHPGGSTRPSAADLHLFSKFGMVHAIIGEPYNIQDVAFFNKSGNRIVVKAIA